jgi:3-hydroxyisobutyrate dehydrogenase-like beta-hydroxyacid dehydrogenase
VQIGVFGLGEAGSLFARDLAAAGVRVRGYDPAPVPTPEGVVRCDAPEDVVPGADAILALTAAADAPTALAQALDVMPDGFLYADLSTSSPVLKRDLARGALERGVQYVDVALVAVVPGKGLRTPALVAGPASARYVELLGPLDVPIHDVGGEVGDAITRKLLRSVVMKGLAALVGEAMDAAGRLDLGDWLWQNIVGEITAADERLVSRLVQGTTTHAVRRLEEMEATAGLLASVGVEPVMTAGTVRSLATAVAARADRAGSGR